MSEQEKPLYKINKWDDNYNPAFSFFKELWISPKWMITIEETQENVLSIVAHHEWENGKSLITHLQVQFERKTEEWFFIPLFENIWRAMDSALDFILQKKDRNKSFNLEKILQEYDYEVINNKTTDSYTYKWKDNDWDYKYTWNNPHFPSVLITSQKKVA